MEYWLDGKPFTTERNQSSLPGVNLYYTVGASFYYKIVNLFLLQTENFLQTESSWYTMGPPTLVHANRRRSVDTTSLWVKVWANLGIDAGEDVITRPINVRLEKRQGIPGQACVHWLKLAWLISQHALLRCPAVRCADLDEHQ